jgi:cell wall-associated NlpC family hydrolase
MPALFRLPVRPLRPLLVALLLGALVATTLLTAPAADASVRSRQRVSHHIITARNIALNQIGDPYAYGASGPNRFDCSGLIYYSYHRAGFSGVPRTSSAQAGHARHISKRALRPGDFMFFTSGSGVYHVAIFLRWVHGRALMLHSPEPGQRVRRAYSWTTHWFGGTLRAR